MSAEKPRVKFCWWCGRRLWGRTFVEHEIQGYPRTLHRACAEDLASGGRTVGTDDEKHEEPGERSEGER
jgi:hypothetical protein